MIDADYVDNSMLLENTPAQAEYLVHSLEEEVRGIYVDVD